MNQTQFFYEDTTFELNEPEKIEKWINEVVKSYQHIHSNINYIICSDPYLLEINREYLNHDYYTDIITFDQSESDGTVEADIFVSIDRVKENAATLGIEPNRELLRVLIHGVLHLCGFQDKTPKDAILMRSKEDQALDLWPFK